MTRQLRWISSGARLRGEPLDVVLIEDHDDTREALRVHLTSHGIHVRAFARVAPGLEAIGDRAPDAVITDLALPGGSGDELAERLRRDDATSHIVLVAISGRVDPSWQVMRWFDVYLRKPIDIEDLHALVEVLCDPSSPRGARRRKDP